MKMCKYGCTRQFQTLAAMEDHRRAFHPDDSAAGSTAIRKKPVAACNDCLKTFDSLEALRHHQLTKPNHIRPSSMIGSPNCEKCNKTFKSEDSLEQHFVADHSIIQLAKGETSRVALEAHFKENWRKPSRPGRVLSVFKIYNPAWRSREFQQYRQQLPQNGNQVSRYHGTTLLCNLGSSAKNSKLCANDGCNLCCVLRTGFKTAKAKHNWQRFGRGIYTTATSGKSDDYIHCSSSQRAVLVCRVLAGNVYRTKNNMPTLESPPQGYDSVSGEVGKVLNYDETVVYMSKAIIPDFMIVYTR